MPLMELEDVRIYYELAGPEQAPVLMLSNSLGTSLEMWQPQMAEVAKDFRILRYDTRGHGRSSVSPGPYSIDQLANDVLALLDRLGYSKVLFCGLSMGGMIAMSLAMKAPQRLSKIVLCNTAPQTGSAEVWNARIETVAQGGMTTIVDGVLERWFTPTFRANSPAAVESTRNMLLNTPATGYVATCAAIRDYNVSDSIATIRVPALIISGSYDPVTSPQAGHFMAENIHGAVYKELPAAHLSNIEAAAAFTSELSIFLKA